MISLKIEVKDGEANTEVTGAGNLKEIFGLLEAIKKVTLIIGRHLEEQVKEELRKAGDVTEQDIDKLMQKLREKAYKKTDEEFGR